MFGMNTDEQIKGLENLKRDLEIDFHNKIRSIDTTINMLLATPTTNGTFKTVISTKTEPIKDGYNKKSAITSKLAFALKKGGKFLHIRQIAEVLNSYEPEIPVKDFVVKLYPAINELKRSGSIVKVSVGKANVNSFWGSKNWLNDKGLIKEEHKYDEDQIRHFGKTEIEI